VLAHDHLSALAVDAQLNAMRLTNADMFDEPEHPRVPGHRLAHIGNSQNRNDARPRRRPVRPHALPSHAHLVFNQPSGDPLLVN
jgi:hypothetical protein